VVRVLLQNVEIVAVPLLDLLEMLLVGRFFIRSHRGRRLVRRCLATRAVLPLTRSTVTGRVGVIMAVPAARRRVVTPPCGRRVSRILHRRIAAMASGVACVGGVAMPATGMTCVVHSVATRVHGRSVGHALAPTATGHGTISAEMSRQQGAEMQYIVHQDPVGRAESNYIAQADLAPFDLDGQIEQLWLLPEEDGTYAVACIPFMTYGLALGDRVRLSAEIRVVEVVQTSGHRVLRALLRPSADTKRLDRSINLIKNSIKESGLLSEWHGERFVAIDVPPGTDMSPLFALLQREVDEAGAFWEWADAVPFSTTRS
jgi:hypothetical protein